MVTKPFRGMVQVSPQYMFIITNKIIPGKNWVFKTRKHHLRFKPFEDIKIEDVIPNERASYGIPYYYNYLTETYIFAHSINSLNSLLKKQGIYNDQKLFWYLI